MHFLIEWNVFRAIHLLVDEVLPIEVVNGWKVGHLVVEQWVRCSYQHVRDGLLLAVLDEVLCILLEDSDVGSGVRKCLQRIEK